MTAKIITFPLRGAMKPGQQTTTLLVEPSVMAAPRRPSGHTLMLAEMLDDCRINPHIWWKQWENGVSAIREEGGKGADGFFRDPAYLQLSQAAEQSGKTGPIPQLFLDFQPE